MKALNVPITNWQGKHVWIIGASTGIGAALAQTLSAQGAILALSARNQTRLADFAQALPNAQAISMDISKPEQIINATDSLQSQWPRIDTVILNAGIYKPLRAFDLKVEEARSMIEVNLLGIINAVAAIAPGMIANQSGNIVIVASVAGYCGLPKALVYGAAKAGLINFAQTLYVELKSKGINVFLVNPGFVATPLTENNDFKMPALISSEQATKYILNGLAKGKFEIHFPYRFTLFLKLLKGLPYRLYFYLTSKLLQK